MVDSDYPHALSDPQQVQLDFYTSLVHLYACFGWPLPTQSFHPVFPINIQLSFEKAKALLEESHPNLELVIVQDDSGQNTNLSTVEFFVTDYDLWFFAVKPYYDLLQSEPDSIRTKLVGSLYRYIEWELGIAYLTDESTRIFSEYDYIEQLYEDIKGAEGEEEEDANWLHELAQQELDLAGTASAAFRKAPTLNESLSLVEQLDQNWPSDIMLDAAIRSFHAFSLKHKGKSVSRDSFPFITAMEEEEADHILTSDGWLSFIWSFESDVYNSICLNLDCEFNSGVALERPKNVVRYNRPYKQPPNSLAFETDLFKQLTVFAEYTELLIKDLTLSDERRNESILQDTPSPAAYSVV